MQKRRKRSKASILINEANRDVKSTSWTLLVRNQPGALFQIPPFALTLSIKCYLKPWPKSCAKALAGVEQPLIFLVF